jgi:hypothetical protein
MKRPPYSHNLAPDDFLMFPNITSAFKGWRFQDTEDKKCDEGTERYSTKGVPEIFPTVLT